MNSSWPKTSVLLSQCPDPANGIPKTRLHFPSISAIDRRNLIDSCKRDTLFNYQIDASLSHCWTPVATTGATAFCVGCLARSGSIWTAVGGAAGIAGRIACGWPGIIKLSGVARSNRLTRADDNSLRWIAANGPTATKLGNDRATRNAICSRSARGPWKRDSRAHPPSSFGSRHLCNAFVRHHAHLPGFGGAYAQYPQFERSREAPLWANLAVRRCLGISEPRPTRLLVDSVLGQFPSSLPGFDFGRTARHVRIIDRWLHTVLSETRANCKNRWSAGNYRLRTSLPGRYEIPEHFRSAGSKPLPLGDYKASLVLGEQFVWTGTYGSFASFSCSISHVTVELVPHRNAQVSGPSTLGGSCCRGAPGTRRAARCRRTARWNGTACCWRTTCSRRTTRWNGTACRPTATRRS